MKPCGTFVEPFGALWNLVESSRNSVEPFETLPRPGPSHTPRRTSTTPQPLQNLVQQWVEPWPNFGGAFVEPSQTTPDHPCGTLPQTTPDPRSPRRIWWNPGGIILQNLVRNLVEPSCNLTSNHGGWNLTSNHPGPPAALAGATLVELSWNLTSNHPGPPPLAEPGGALMEPSWNLASNQPRPPRSPRRTWWNSWNITPNHPAS